MHLQAQTQSCQHDSGVCCQTYRTRFCRPLWMSASWSPKPFNSPPHEESANPRNSHGRTHQLSARPWMLCRWKPVARSTTYIARCIIAGIAVNVMGIAKDISVQPDIRSPYTFTCTWSWFYSTVVARGSRKLSRVCKLSHIWETHIDWAELPAWRVYNVRREPLPHHRLYGSIFLSVL